MTIDNAEVRKADHHVAPQADHGDQAKTILNRIAQLRAWLFLAGLIVTFEIWARIDFGGTFIGSSFNWQSVAIFAVAPLLLAIGQTFVIISGGIDLSTGFIMGLAAVVAAHIANIAGLYMPLPIAMVFGILVAMLAAAVPGFINGLLISRLKVPPFIGTLGMFGVARGTAFLIAGGTTVPVKNSYFAELGNGRLYGVPYLVIVTLVFVVIMHYLLSQTRFGQHNYAIGANAQAARRAGIDIKSHLLRLYILSAVCAGLGGALYAARFTAGAAQAGEPLLLDSVAAVVIGGASLFGGSGTIIGTIAGALVIAVIQYGLVFMNVEPFWQFIAVGIVIIISVLIDQAQRRFSGAKQDE
ncbi:MULTISPECIES: ribose ABC transporter [Rhizobium]|uniref:Autoinducer 2 import system permease protein LsrD n=1 Tax=Rhizobium tropici TaxID=398 RepID=A0A329Y9F5_RHITR|nr:MULTISPECIES: ribose ABC transporter [Rhizobium]MBB3285704.1 ribose transport system permease protein [Rhizobium sp. BK252]MBB3400444.1 ribose transport system permease protein [Rhizobium sp. BK289]MBB3413023.1 ribose transport system permease protein [Rhizobium sp. BK284]MBB3480910.1 ribose transport system permease protein [Rhizobium sp. BK347]MDK4721584.1 ribose ABC transporter [Rhizobium sp. CNPSo 3968]